MRRTCEIGVVANSPIFILGGTPPKEMKERLSSRDIATLKTDDPVSLFDMVSIKGAYVDNVESLSLVGSAPWYAVVSPRIPRPRMPENKPLPSTKTDSQRLLRPERLGGKFASLRPILKSMCSRDRRDGVTSLRKCLRMLADVTSDICCLGTVMPATVTLFRYLAIDQENNTLVGRARKTHSANPISPFKESPPPYEMFMCSSLIFPPENPPVYAGPKLQ